MHWTILVPSLGYVATDVAGEWSDQIAEATRFDERDSRPTKLAWFKAQAELLGFDATGATVVEL